MYNQDGHLTSIQGIVQAQMIKPIANNMTGIDYLIDFLKIVYMIIDFTKCGNTVKSTISWENRSKIENTKIKKHECVFGDIKDSTQLGMEYKNGKEMIW